MAKKENNYKAPALEKGLDILEYLSYKRAALSQTEIAEGTNKTMNEIYRMLVCLENRGYLIREHHSGKYRLSLKLYSLAHRHSLIDEIRNVAQTAMKELSSAIRQSCHLGIIYQDQLMVINQSKSPEPISLSVEEGSLFPLLRTASGLTLLSILHEDTNPEILNRLKQFHDYSKQEKNEFITTLKEIRKQGYHTEISKLASGVTDVVVPIGNATSRIVAALAVPVLTNELDKFLDLTKVIDAAKQTADIITINLGLKSL